MKTEDKMGALESEHLLTNIFFRVVPLVKYSLSSIGITVITLKVSSYSCSPLRLRDKKKRKVKKIHAQGLMVPFLLSHP